jgi:concanavalin A-like lectin/glucanase superfamily protein
MAGSRSFNADDEVVFDASWNAAPTAAFSIAVVVKPTTVVGEKFLMEPRSSLSDDYLFFLDDATPTVYADGVGLIAADASMAATTAWQVLGVSKPAGTSQLRFHRVRLSDGVASHVAAASGSDPVPDLATSDWALARYRYGSIDFTGLIAAAGVWNIDLADAKFAEMISWTGMLGTAPRALWRLDGSPDFIDETGRNNDQASRRNTTHDSDAPSGFWPVDTTGRSYGGYGSNNWPPASWRPYKSTSIWNTPIDTRIDVVHRDSAAMVRKILSLSGNPTLPVGHLVAGRVDTGSDYSHPLFFAREDDPWFTLDFRYHNASGWGPNVLQGTRLQIPDLAKPASGDDAHMVIVQPPERDARGNYVRDANGNYVYWEYDLWQVVGKPAGGGTLRCSWGGRHDFEGDGYGPGAAGTAAHFGLVAGTVRANELVAGQIDHALFCVVQIGANPDDLDFGYGVRRGDSENGSHVFPAANGDSFDDTVSDDDCPPMGARLWLEMTETEINALSVPGWKKTILKALARYGAFFGDTGGPGFAFQFDGGSAYTSFGVADPLIAYGADNGLTQYTDLGASSPIYGDYVFNMSSGVDWARYLRVVIPPVGPYAAAVFTDEPVSWWRLGESSGSTAVDQTDANPGTYASASLGATSLLATVANDTAATFNGSSTRVEIDDDGSLDLTSAFSLEAWINPTDLASGAFRSILTKAEAYALQFNNGQLEFTIMQSGTRQRLRASAGAIVTGTTYHVVATYDGSTQRLYVNGSEVVNRSLSGAATTNTAELYIGSWDGGSEYYRGVIDEVAVYDVTLTPTQVARHYAAGTTG